MRLEDVLPAAGGSPAAGIEVRSLTHDNRQVGPGTLFFCVPGFTADGHDFARQAIETGAVALVVQRPLGLGVPEFRVDSVRAAMAPAAARFYGDPTRRLRTVGITGTNGKTTTAFLVRALLEAAGHKTGLLGTVKSVIGGVEHEVERTTPEAIDLQRTFHAMLDGGDTACAMEVSSHALALHRADAIHFEVAVFTNMSRDHLDFHPTMESYFQAKRRLFCDLAPAHSVINVDDAYGARLAAGVRDAITFAIDRPATYRASGIAADARGSSFTVIGPEGELVVASPLRGRFNVYNVLAAMAAARAWGVAAETILAALPSVGQVPGRFQMVDEGQDFAVVVDYAHTPDSLENVLHAARGMTDRRVHVVFGCGGDRDRGKRPQMGAVAARLADRVIVTSDNPRSEEPEAIIEEILAGIPTAVERAVDRRAAIEQALSGAAAGDVVVIAGKGHEQGQEFSGGHRIPFDDVAVAQAALRHSVQRAPA